MNMLFPTGVRFGTYATEGRYIHTRPQALWFAAFLLALLILPQVASLYATGVLTVMFITLMAVYGLQVTVGTAGQINVAQSAFMGIGAFAAAKLSSVDVPFWLAIPAARSRRRRAVDPVRAAGHPREGLLSRADDARGAGACSPSSSSRCRPTGWAGPAAWRSSRSALPGACSVRRPTCTTSRWWASLICSVCAFNLQRSRFGRALRTVRDNELAAEVTGINVSYYKVMSFFAGSLFAGVAGGFFAYYIRYVTTENFNLLLSIWYLGMLIVGGLASPLGAIFGTVFVTIVQEVFHALGGSLLAAYPNLGGGLVFATSNVILGICILLALIFEPRGLAHRWGVLKAAYRIWPFPHS